MGYRAVFASCLVLVTGVAVAEPLPTCEEAGLGIEDVIGIDGKFAKAYLEGNVVLRAVDTVEPACCSSGVAIVTPDPDDESGGAKCSAAIQFRGLDLSKAKHVVKGKELTISIPNLGKSGEEENPKTVMLKIKINTETYAVSAEQ